MTPHAIELHPEAEAEAREARRWYAQRDEAAAARFMDALDRAMVLISNDPERWPAFASGTRRIAMRRFPFSLIYRVLDRRVLVLAVAHQRRRPGYWSSR